MNITDKARTITAVRATGPSSLHLSWSEGTAADLDLGAVLADRAFAALRDPGEFAKVEVGDWGHSLAWPSGAELGADMLWLETLSATGHGDVRAFLEWRLRHALSLSKAADALAYRAAWSPTTPTAKRRCRNQSCWRAGAGKPAMGYTGPPNRT